MIVGNVIMEILIQYHVHYFDLSIGLWMEKNTKF
jgi:hypothetical protein